MLKKRIATVLLLTVLVLNFPPTAESDSTSEWTFMVYLDGDNNLEKFGINDFLEMAQVGSIYDVNILVQFDRRAGYDSRYDDWQDARRFRITKGMEPYRENSIQALGEVDMADPQVLFEFLNWSAINYPAKKYFLVLWDHGQGWEGIIQDDNSGNIMETPELSQALAQFQVTHGRKIDVVAFDACRMMLEMAYEMKAYADYFVGSQKDVPDRGFPYDTVLETLIANPLITPSNAAKQLVDDYVEFYTHNTIFAVTLASVESSSLDDLKTELNPLLGEMLLELAYFSEEIKTARDQTESYDGDNQYDLYHFMEKIQEKVISKRLKVYAENIKTIIEDSVYENKWDNPSAQGTKATNAHGLAIWLPTYISLSRYHDLSFSNDTLWDEFLDNYSNDYTKPQASLEVNCTSEDLNLNGYKDSVHLDLLSTITGNLTIDIYSQDYLYSKDYDMVANEPQTDTIALLDNRYYTMHFYLTNFSGYLQYYTELINPLSSLVDLSISFQNISISPDPTSTTIGTVQTISAIITNYGPLDALDIDVSFYASTQIGGESPDENNDGYIDFLYTGSLIGQDTIDIYADKSDFRATAEASIEWDTNSFYGQIDLWVCVDYNMPGNFEEAEEIINNKARYWTGSFYTVEPRTFYFNGTIILENGSAPQLDIVLLNLRTLGTIRTNTNSSKFVISFQYPIWAEENDILEINFDYQNKKYAYQIVPDYTKSSYTFHMVLEDETGSEMESPNLLPAYLVQLVFILIILIPCIAYLSRKKK